MKKRYSLVLVLVLSIANVVLAADFEKSDLELNLKDSDAQVEIDSMHAVLLYQTMDNKEATVPLTKATKDKLEKTLAAVITVFENTGHRLAAGNSGLEIAEVEIFAALGTGADFKVVTGSAEASFRIILRPKAKD